MVLSAAAAATAEIPLVIPDAGPWITLAYADVLHLLEAPGCIKVTTRAWLLFLERQQLIASANAIERQAILAGRRFYRLRFPRD